MSEPVATAPKAKKITKAKVGRQVRLWVRAKFLSFRRYINVDSDQDKTKTPTRLSSVLRESTIDQLLNTISERELLTSTKPIPAKPKTDLEYNRSYLDHLGSHFHHSRKHRSCSCQILHQPPRKSHWINTQSHAFPSTGLILYLFKSRFFYIIAPNKPCRRHQIFIQLKKIIICIV